MPTADLQSFDLVIRNGEVVTTAGKQRLDIGVSNGKITALAENLSQPAPQKINATGMLIFPGIIDAHTHMGIPVLDTISADDFSSGSLAAAYGGVTTILDFSVQENGQSLHDAVAVRLRQAENCCRVDYGLHVNITSQPEKCLREIVSLAAAGFKSFKLFFTYEQMMVNLQQFYQILTAVQAVNGLVMLHAEDHATITRLVNRHLAAGEISPIFHARSHPPVAEAQAITQAAKIAGDVGAPLYVVHLSSQAGLGAALQARERGVQLFLETCPQYLLLTEEKFLKENGHWFITTPPLRTSEDTAALWQAIAQNQVDVIATDHCPFTIAQKNCGGGNFDRTPNGLPGVETLFPLLYTYGVCQGRISLRQLVKVLALNPAQIFGLAPSKGEIKIGTDADLMIWNPTGIQNISANQLHGRADWSPYEGMALSGYLSATVLRGNIIVKDGRLQEERGIGRVVHALK